MMVSGLNAWVQANMGPLAVGLVLLIAGLIALVVFLWLRVRRSERRYAALTAGTSGGSLEAVLEEHVGTVRATAARVTEVDELARGLQRASRSHLQRVGFLRFNPFRDAGGDQSFALVLVDGEGNGVVISSLHSREASRVYGKPLAGWQSAYPLTDEEKQAIRRAQGD